MIGDEIVFNRKRGRESGRLCKDYLSLEDLVRIGHGYDVSFYCTS